MFISITRLSSSKSKESTRKRFLKLARCSALTFERARPLPLLTPAESPKSPNGLSHLLPAWMLEDHSRGRILRSSLVDVPPCNSSPARHILQHGGGVHAVARFQTLVGTRGEELACSNRIESKAKVSARKSRGRTTNQQRNRARELRLMKYCGSRGPMLVYRDQLRLVARDQISSLPRNAERGRHPPPTSPL